MIIGINYTGGFCVANSKIEMDNILKNNKQIIARLYPTIGEAYMELVKENADRNIATDTIPVAARYESFRSLPYFIHPNNTFKPQDTARTFVLWNLEYCGIYTDIELAINDFIYMGTLILLEVANELEAVKVINNRYKKVIFPLLPEISEKIPFLSGPIEENVLHKMPYPDILGNLFLVNDIRELNPYVANKEIGHEPHTDGGINPIELIN